MKLNDGATPAIGALLAPTSAPVTTCHAEAALDPLSAMRPENAPAVCQAVEAAVPCSARGPTVSEPETCHCAGAVPDSATEPTVNDPAGTVQATAAGVPVRRVRPANVPAGCHVLEGDTPVRATALVASDPNACQEARADAPESACAPLTNVPLVTHVADADVP